MLSLPRMYMFLCAILLSNLYAISALDRSSCLLFGVKEQFPDLDEPCFHSPYKGPVGDTILTYTPRTIAKATKDHSQALLENMSTFAGNLPVVGSFFSSALTLYSSNFGSSVEGTINKIVEEIQTEINDLKKYVDARIQEHEVTRLSQELRGFLNGAKLCSTYDTAEQADDMSSCLVALNLRLVTEYPNFAPSNDRIASYEQTLPLFRQFGDLHLTVLQDLMKRDKLSDKTETFNDHLVTLKERAQTMYDYSKKAVRQIVRSHTEGYPARSCSTFLEWHNPNNPFSTMKGQCSKCTQLFDGKECYLKHCVSPKVRGGQTVASESNQFCIEEYRKQFVIDLKKDLETYWNLEIIQIAEDWKKIADKAGEEAKRMKIPEKKHHRKVSTEENV